MASLCVLRFSSDRPADPAEPRLPAGGPGSDQPGRPAVRTRHLHGQIHREAVQPDRLLLHHDDWSDLTRLTKPDSIMLFVVSLHVFSSSDHVTPPSCFLSSRRRGNSFGRAGNRARWRSDEEDEPFGGRGQQTVQHRHRAVHIHCSAAAADWLPHSDGRWDFSSQVAFRSRKTPPAGRAGETQHFGSYRVRS